MLKTEEELLKKLSIADLERANAYARDLGQGLQAVRSFSQGVTIFGSARLPQDNKYCKMARNGRTPKRWLTRHRFSVPGQSAKNVKKASKGRGQSCIGAEPRRLKPRKR